MNCFESRIEEPSIETIENSTFKVHHIIHEFLIWARNYIKEQALNGYEENKNQPEF